jgi:hypothetical protein
MAPFERVNLAGAVRVPLAPEQAFALFTPSGERRWAEGWDPSFPASAADDTEPGTVFQTAHGHGQTETWVVVAREPERSMTYANVLPGERASRITVVCEPDGNGATIAKVSYQLTPLSKSGAKWLKHFTAHYPQFMKHWETAIARALTA